MMPYQRCPQKFPARFQAYFLQKYRIPLWGYQLKRGLPHRLIFRFAKSGFRSLVCQAGYNTIFLGIFRRILPKNTHFDPQIRTN